MSRPPISAAKGSDGPSSSRTPKGASKAASVWFNVTVSSINTLDTRYADRTRLYIKKTMFWTCVSEGTSALCWSRWSRGEGELNEGSFEVMSSIPGGVTHCKRHVFFSSRNRGAYVEMWCRDRHCRSRPVSATLLRSSVFFFIRGQSTMSLSH